MNQVYHSMDGLAKFMGACAILTFMSFGAVVFLIKAPIIEGFFDPVWGEAHFELESVSPTTIVGYMYGLKNRGECRPREFVVTVLKNNRWETAQFEVAGRSDKYASRPDGWQMTGPWIIHKRGSQLRITGHFECHDMWITPSELGTWPIPE